jgi:hypothetical protein
MILIAAVSLAVFAIVDKSAGARSEEDAGGIDQVLANQKAILEKLDTIERKIDILRTRIY